MTASRRERRATRGAGAWGAAAAALLLAACATPAPRPAGSPVEPLPRLGAALPDDADRAARDLAAAVLGSDRRAVDAGVARLLALDAERAEGAEPPSGLLPWALDARNALADERTRREASAALLERDDLEPELRARLDEEVRDDPLRLASARLRDARVSRWGRRVNALVEPAGRSITSTFLLPWRMLQGVVGLALVQHQEDRLTLPERQALDHWKRFIERHPDAPEAAALLAQVEDAQRRWLRTKRDRLLRDARQALDEGDAALALTLADHALRYSPEDPDAHSLREEAAKRRARGQARRARSLSASPDAHAVAPAQRPLLVALLAARDPAPAAAEALRARAPEGSFADETGFVVALAEREAGAEAAVWERLEALAERSDAASAMARHARAELVSPVENPYRAFRGARAHIVAEKARWAAFGPLAHGARRRDLPRAVEWLVEVPAVVGVVAGLPNRLIRLPFLRAEWEEPAVLARRYLERVPQGEHAEEVRGWLVDHEAGRGNHVGALRLAESAPAPDAEEIAALRERAAEQALEASLAKERLDVRIRLLREVAASFPDTPAARKAGERLREDVKRATPQQIRISRAFLAQHPGVAGPEGLALRPALLDGDASNGELHAEGVTLLGGRAVEFAFLGPSGRDGDPPERVRRLVSSERLARAVAQLEESALREALVDRDVPVEHDADRDTYFERARLGVAEPADPRLQARSSYTFRTARERYGLVRSRESILPVEIVLQGSFEDFGLGAFPRIRMPKLTPDAFLYR